MAPAPGDAAVTWDVAGDVEAEVAGEVAGDVDAEVGGDWGGLTQLPVPGPALCCVAGSADRAACQRRQTQIPPTMRRMPVKMPTIQLVQVISGSISGPVPGPVSWGV